LVVSSENQRSTSLIQLLDVGAKQELGRSVALVELGWLGGRKVHV
jgi:hypothetical protein